MADLPEWPATLPAPDRSGYQYSLGFGLVRTPFEGGYVRQRRTSFAMPGAFAMEFRMNTKQLGILQVFLDKIGYGWFAMDLVTGAARIWRPLSDCILHKIRFTADPVFAMIAPNLWQVTLQAEVASMRDPRAYDGAVVRFDFVDDVKPELVDSLTDWDTLSL